MMMVTKAERDLILEMLASKRISTAEARQLFDAIECCIKEEYGCNSDCFSDFMINLDHVFKRGIRKATRAVKEFILDF
jgi:thiaminase